MKMFVSTLDLPTEVVDVAEFLAWLDVWQCRSGARQLPSASVNVGPFALSPQQSPQPRLRLRLAWI